MDYIRRAEGKAPEKRLIPALEAADARTFGADHSVLGILSMSMTYLYSAVLVLCSGVIKTHGAYGVTILRRRGVVAVGVTMRARCCRSSLLNANLTYPLAASCLT